MAQGSDKKSTGREHCFIDYLLYILAGSVLAAISFSFLLWLRF
jgi:hypothetical protein